MAKIILFPWRVSTPFLTLLTLRSVDVLCSRAHNTVTTDRPAGGGWPGVTGRLKAPVFLKGRIIPYIYIYMIIYIYIKYIYIYMIIYAYRVAWKTLIYKDPPTEQYIQSWGLWKGYYMLLYLENDPQVPLLLGHQDLTKLTCSCRTNPMMLERVKSG